MNNTENTATLDNFEMPPPTDTRNLLLALRKMEEIERDADFAMWSREELATIASAWKEILDPVGGHSRSNIGLFFLARARLKTLVRRLADEPRWSALAQTLAINLKPLKPADGAEIEQAVIAMSRPRVREVGWLRSDVRLLPTWTAEEIELIRRVVYTAERRERRFTRKDRRKLLEGDTALGDVLMHHGHKVAWELAIDALDLDIRRNFWERATGLIFDS
jgi:hypothetical protein